METVMDAARQKYEVDRNYDVFVRLLSALLPEHRDQFALMRDGKIVDFFEKPGDANRVGVEAYPDGVFSIQEVTDEPIDLGFWSHVTPH